MKRYFIIALSFLIAVSASAQETAGYKFDFGDGATAPGYTRVGINCSYTDELGYGFEMKPDISSVIRLGKGRKAKNDPLTSDFITGSGPFSFSVKLPEGNYKVTVTLGDLQGESMTSVKSEQRRLMLEGVKTSKKEIVTRSFGVNVRNHTLSPGNSIKFDTREWDYAAGKALMNTWDDKLTLTFCDTKPAVCAVEIEPVNDAIVVYLIGDSTVTDQAGSTYCTWGQMLPRWFRLPVIVANHAESGQTAKAFRFQRRWDKVIETLKPGDYVLIQFGTNDAKESGHDAMWPADDKAGEWSFTHADARTDYVWLLASYAVEVRRHGAIPVIVSPMTKIDLRSGDANPASLGEYPQGAKAAAELAGCKYIDLFDMSLEVVKALGSESPLAYADGTHPGNFGAYLYSRCIAKGLRDAGLGIADYLIDCAADFNPAFPEPALELFDKDADNALPQR